MVSTRFKPQCWFWRDHDLILALWWDPWWLHNGRHRRWEGRWSRWRRASRPKHRLVDFVMLRAINVIVQSTIIVNVLAVWTVADEVSLFAACSRFEGQKFGEALGCRSQVRSCREMTSSPSAGLLVHAPRFCSALRPLFTRLKLDKPHIFVCHAMRHPS